LNLLGFESILSRTLRYIFIDSILNALLLVAQADKNPALSNALGSMKIQIQPFMIEEQILNELMVELVPTKDACHGDYEQLLSQLLHLISQP